MPDTIDNLSDLLEAIKANTYTDVEMSSLPNFGGSEPQDTLGIWSWSAEEILFGEGLNEMQILSRSEYADLMGFGTVVLTADQVAVYDAGDDRDADEMMSRVMHAAQRNADDFGISVDIEHPNFMIAQINPR